MVSKNKIISLRLRAKHAHDIKDVKYLLAKAKKRPSTLVMDKAYDAEWLLEYCNDKHNIKAVVPPRRNSFRGFYRKRLIRKFPQRMYNKRSIVESTFHALKQKFGSSVSSRKMGSARTEIYCRAILHNLFLLTIQVLGHSR